MLAAVLAIFLAASAAPFVVRRLGARAMWGLALVPAACFLFLLTRLAAGAHDPMVGHGAAHDAAETSAAGAGHSHGPDAGHAEAAALVGDRAVGDRWSVPWIDAADVGFGVDLAFRLDGLSMLLALLVTGVGALVLIYTGGYLRGDDRLPRFAGVLMAFMGSMLGLVLADDVVAMFVFWESTSVTSYLLIGFDRHRAAARRAAMQALVVTGAGGLAMLAGLLMLGSAAGTFSLSGIIEARTVVRASPVFLPAMGLVLAGCFTKSAQFPFHFWLPNAMEAPTPVSSYLHSATMVKAGVYLIARLNPVFGGADGTWELVLIVFGGLTAVLAAGLALRQDALKKLLAYSTTASLSVMIMAIGLGTEAGAAAAMTFLLAHALYKCCLFQTAGTITHATGVKDVNRLGGLRSAMPLAAAGGMLGAFGMMGLPPFLGYLGKEVVIGAGVKAAPSVQIAATAVAMFAGAVFVMIGGATALRPFLGPRIDTPTEPHDPPPAMWLGPVVLGGLGLLAGGSVLLGDPLSPWLLGPAAASVRGAEVHPHLSFWHGLDSLAMWLDVVVLLLGVGLLLARPRLERAMSGLDPMLGRGPDRGFDLMLRGLEGTAGGLTSRLQSGVPGRSLSVIVAFTVIMVGWGAWGGLAEFPSIAERLDVSPPQVHELITAVCILLGCLVVVRTRSRLSAIGGLSLIGYGVALFFVFFGAPDLAITQFLIETLSVLLLVLVFWKLPAFRRRTSAGGRLRDGIIAGVFGTLMAVLVLVAAQSELGDRDAASYYAATSYEEAHGRNVVNVILVDFRGVDTMGEITVLTIAALGVLALIRLPGAARPSAGSGEDAA